MLMRLFLAALLLAVGLGFTLYIVGIKATAAQCERLGWFPAGFGLKDHSVFWHNGYYYLVSIYEDYSRGFPEDRFAYGRSPDLCSWEDLSPILAERIPGTWDESKIWAPFVYKEGNLYYMYYTGVTFKGTQSIMLAISTDPSDPNSWRSQGVIFQPYHPGMIWQNGAWSDCRDPMILKVADIYYLYYTGRDESGGIVGVATSTSPEGPWYDWGAIIVTPNAMPESPTVVSYGGFYYLFYNEARRGERYRIGASPTGPWSNPAVFSPGWAHEVWYGQDGNTYTSFLTDYTVTISRIAWDNFFYPPVPFIGSKRYHLMLPLIIR